MRILIILFAGILISCGTFKNIANPGEAYTGTANEPGTPINPFPLSDFYEAYPKSVQQNEVMMDDEFVENELVRMEDSIVYEDIKPDPEDIILDGEIIETD